VTVYARRILPVSRVAAMVSVIPQEAIERTLVTDVKQLVRYEPGLSVRSDPFRFGTDTISVRGVGGNRVAVEVTASRSPVALRSAVSPTPAGASSTRRSCSRWKSCAGRHRRCTAAMRSAAWSR